MAVLRVVVVFALGVLVGNGRVGAMGMLAEQSALDLGDRILPVAHVGQHWQHRDREEPGGALRTHGSQHTALPEDRAVHTGLITWSNSRIHPAVEAE